MRNNQSTNQCAAQSCSFTFTSSETMDFRGKACSKNNSSLERVDSRVQHRWRLRVMGSCFSLLLTVASTSSSKNAIFLPKLSTTKFKSLLVNFFLNSSNSFFTPSITTLWRNRSLCPSSEMRRIMAGLDMTSSGELLKV